MDSSARAVAPRLDSTKCFAADPIRPPRADGIRRKTLGRIEPRGDGSRARIHFSLSRPTGRIRTNPACRARQPSRGFSGIRMNFPLFVRWLLWPFSFLFGVFVRMRAWYYRVGILAAKSLRQPVISIGNLTIGGTGKTPLVLWLAQRLQAQGKRVGILSRGYHSGGRGTWPGASKASSKEIPSDEVRLLAGRLRLPIGVGANRYRTALAMEPEKIEVFLLDDGFQHLRLARDLDIVLVDATNPFGGGWLLPAGPLREPHAALSRADVVVITRSEHA